MRVALVEPPYASTRFDYVPQGLLSLAAALEEEGFDVEVHVGHGPYSADVLGISFTHCQYAEAISIARRSNAEITIAGGAAVTTDPFFIMLSKVFDYGIMGDAEIVLPQFLLTRSTNLPGMVIKLPHGITFRPNEDLPYRERGLRMPIPAYHLINHGSFINITRNREFFWANPWKRRNLPKIYSDFKAEIDILNQRGVKGVFVTDTEFGAWHQNIRSTLEALDQLDFWHCRTTVRNAFLRRLPELLRGTNCCLVEIDAVSLHPAILAQTARHTLEDIETLVKLFNQMNIIPRLHITVGWPCETIETLQHNLRAIRAYDFALSIFNPLPGDKYWCSPEYWFMRHFGISGTTAHDFSIKLPLTRLNWYNENLNKNVFMSVMNEFIETTTGEIRC